MGGKGSGRPRGGLIPGSDGARLLLERHRGDMTSLSAVLNVSVSGLYLYLTGQREVTYSVARLANKYYRVPWGSWNQS